MKIFIATPMYGGFAKDSYTISLKTLIDKLSDRGHTASINTIGNESLITRARNTLAYVFMKTDFDAMLFIDADHGWDSDGLIKMIESGKDIIGAISPMKIINWENVRLAALAGETDLEKYSGSFAVNLLKKDGPINLNEPLEVENIGTGMMFISRKVFERLAPKCQTYRHGDAGSKSIGYGELVVEYFTTFIDENSTLLSEDYAFCKMWKNLGEKVWAAPWVGITHSGSYEFSGQFVSSVRLINKFNAAQNRQK